MWIIFHDQTLNGLPVRSSILLHKSCKSVKDTFTTVLHSTCTRIYVLSNINASTYEHTNTYSVSHLPSQHTVPLTWHTVHKSFPKTLWLLPNYGTVSPGVSTACISELVKQSCKAQTNPWHPLAIPQDRAALTRPCCPVPGATTIAGNVFIARTDGLQTSIFSRSWKKRWRR